MEYESSPQQAGESEKKSLVVGNGSTEESPPPMPEDNAAVTGRKKGKKEGEDDDDVVFSGKKKKGGGGGVGRRSVFTASSFGLLGDDEMSGFSGKEEEDVSLVAFSGKKKKSSRKSSSSSVAANVSDETGFGSESVDDVVVEHEELPGLEVSNTTVAVADNNNVSSRSEEEVTAISKNKGKNKKKKSVRTAQEEDEEDLDKILAELGEGPTIAKPDDAPPPPPQDDDDVNAALGEKEGEDETVESAAAAANKKKKKKKKEKEKEKKVAAISAAAAAGSALENETREEVKAAEPIESKKNGSFNKAAGEKKKVPKHVREMQEALARRKEEEERKKREEEERLMKEEDERRRHEELERQAEEARRRKKEKEKEKLQRKKQEGKLLTFKQKEEARRLEIMRKQFLNNSTCDVMILPTALGKRPIYRAKKPKPAHHHQESGAAAAVETAESVEETKGNQEMTTTNAADPEQVEDEEVEEKVELLLEAGGEDGNGVEEEDDLEEDEWDAKSWDDDDVILNAKGAFADEEEVDSEPESVVKQETKTTAVTAAHSAATTMKTVSKSMTRETENRNQATDKNRKPNPDSKREPPEYAVPREPPKSTLPKETPKSTVPPKILSVGNLRSPICCIMGHVDAGKTKLLDCIRGTNVQEGEAGGITQQIGATYFPAENIRERTKELKADAKLEVPGLLVIDTPGHKPFTKLRSRGSGLCDIVILVVDITRGLKQRTTEKTTKKTTAKTIEETTEETTTELLNLLKNRNTEFIIALNKVDRLYGWKTCRNSPIVKAMKQQTKNVQIEFNMKVTQIIAQFKEHGLNTALYYKNKEMGETFSIVPTSAISGEGIPDLLLLLVQWTQKTMVGKLTYSEEVKCTVLEVKVLEGHGTTLDVVLVNGVLHEGDQIVVCGMQGPIVTTIRALLTPHPMKELRVKGTYLHHEEIKAAMGIKISARGLEHAIAGTDLYVVKVDDDLEDVKEVAMEDMRSVMNKIDTSGVGVCVQASTLGSLEALLELLKSEVKVPVSAISIGPVHKKDVMKASIMLAKNRKYAAILAFDVKVTPEARELADELGVKFFIADVFYQLSDQFKAYIESINAEEKREAADQTVFPCVLKILPDCIFNKKDPIVLGVDVLEGIAKVGTPICIPFREFVDIGRIASIQYNHKPVDSAKKGQQIAIKIVGSHPEEQHKMYGRHFDNGDELVSRISERYTPDRADMTKDEWNLLMKLKNVFKIQRGGLI